MVFMSVYKSVNPDLNFFKINKKITRDFKTDCQKIKKI